MTKHRIYTTSFASVYPHYVRKVEKQGRRRDELDALIEWLTGYDGRQLQAVIDSKTEFETFFANAPKLNPDRALITGVICGVRIDEITEPTMREIRYLDKIVDELAKGRPLSKIMRAAA